MKRGTLWFVVVFVLAALSAGCNGGTMTPTPGITGTWIDAPLDGATIPDSPYMVMFHSASVMGMSEFELWIDGQMAASIPPQTTGSGGSQGTLFMAEYEWNPAGPGQYILEVIPRDQQNQPGPSAQAEVTVAEVMVAQSSPPVLQTAEDIEPTPQLTLIVPEAPTATPTPDLGQKQIIYSEEIVYWRGSGCGSKELEIQIELTEPAASSVVLFARLKDQGSDKVTDWYVKAMNPQADGWYGHSLVPEREFDSIMEFEMAYLQVQVVATDANGNEVVRTPVDGTVMVEYCGR